MALVEIGITGNGGYGPDQVSKMTVGELISELENYESDDKIYLYDGGNRYGAAYGYINYVSYGKDEEDEDDMYESNLYSSFKKNLKESQKLNEGAQSFAQVGEGTDAKTVFNELVEEAYYNYGHDPYNGTISTTDFGGRVIKIADVYSEEADTKAREYIEQDDNGEKWESRCLDLGELPDKPGVHKYVFYGWAAI